MFTLIKRDLKIAFRSLYSVLAVLAFFLIVTFIFAFALSTDDILLKNAFPAIIFINAIMASILTIPDLIRRDYETKILEQIYLQSTSMQKIICSKILSHWISTGLILAIFSGLISFISGRDSQFSYQIFIAILFASPVISIIAVLTSTITLGVRSGGIIASIISIPLYIPLILFSISNILDVSDEVGAFQFLVSFTNIAALFLFLCPLAILVGGYSLKLAIED
jgi:heme exporter protein B